MHRLSRLVHEDTPFYAVIAIYAAAALAAALWLGDLKWFTPAIYLPLWLGGIATAVTILAISWSIASAHKADFATTFAARFDDWPRFLAGLLLFLWIGLFLGIFTSVKVMMPRFMPFAYDGALAKIDRALHGADPWTYLRWMRPYESLIRYLYSPLWLTILSIGAFVVCISKWHSRRQCMWTFLMCWIVLGNVVPLAFMAAGPVYYGGITGSDRFAELSNFVFAQANSADPTSLVPHNLWDGYIQQTPGLGLGISAFPSLHISMAMLFVLAAFKKNRRLGYVMIGYLLFIVIGSVHLGWHYAVDGYVSILGTMFIWKLAGLKLIKTHPAPQEAQRA